MDNKFNEVVIIGAVRTPIGSYKGSLKDIKADQLGAIVIKEVINRSNINKEEISVGRAPTKESVKLNAGEDLINMEIRKLEQDIINTREPHQERLYTETTTLEPCSITTPKNSLPNDMNTTRMEPEILDTFKNNPYTQSLNSFGLN